MMQGEEHTNSYYAATRSDHTSYPVLEGEQEAEICIVGGGFTGIACALTLSERGHSVAVVEQNRVGWGASGRNGGQLIAGVGGSRHLAKHLGWDKVWSLNYRGNEIITERVEKYAIDCDLKSGFIEVALKSSHLKDLAEDYQDHVDQGLGDYLRMVDRDELHELLGTHAYIGGMINQLNGHLHPLNLCAGEARAAADLGASIFEHSQVQRIVKGPRVRVETPHGAVSAEKVLIAGNAYHKLEQAKLSGLVFPAGSFIIASEPLSQNMVQKINPQDLAVCDMNHVVDYYRLSADKRMLFGGRCNYSGKVPNSIKGAMLPRMQKVYPELEGVRIEYEWGGNIGIVVRRVPLLGRLADNVFYAMGYSGHGVAPTHIAAEVMANAVEGDTEVLEVYEKIKHWRIPGGRWFGNQIVALGMLYYRALDMSPL